MGWEGEGDDCSQPAGCPNQPPGPAVLIQPWASPQHPQIFLFH